jgi:hypothetical protein
MASIVVLAGCAVDPSTSPESTASVVPTERLRPGVTAPELIKRSPSTAPITLAGNGSITHKTPAGVRVDLTKIKAASVAGKAEAAVRGGKRIHSQFSDEQIAEARDAATEQQFSPSIQNIELPGGKKPKQESKFEAIDGGDCCINSGFGGTVPPDPHMAASHDHLIVVVNIAFQIYDKEGNAVTAPIAFSDFFTGVPGCTSHAGGFAAVFDPIVVYDEVTNRFVMGIDGNGDSFCVAATQQVGNVFLWFAYGFPTNVNGAFFDFPHMGVGPDAIIMGSNQFGGTLPNGFEGRVFAMDKADMYAGAPLDVVTRPVQASDDPANLKLDGTPQPAHYHASDLVNGVYRHYIMAEFFDGKSHAVYFWDDPFGTNDFDLMGDVDLAAASGVPCENFECFPVPWPQKRSVEILEGNDFRGQETAIRNGYLWTTQTISCNPGMGTRNCVRWAQIDPTLVEPGDLDPSGFPLVSGTNGVIQAGVLGSRKAFRQFPALDVNTCGDMVIGYSAGAKNLFPSVYVTGRRASDALGTLGGERKLLKGKTAYSSFQDNGGQFPERWGDYTEVAMDPDGKTFWYVGEFADKDVDNPFLNWATVVGSFEWRGCEGYNGN